MQSLKWYRHRLMAMSAGELGWRLQCKLRDRWERRRARNSRLPGVSEITCSRKVNSEAFPSITGITGPTVPPLPPEVRQRLIQRAELILQNRLTLFDLIDHPLGDRINWNYEYKADRPTPMTWATDIDYRDYRETGDCKFAWEPSRFQHLVVLGRAYLLSGDRRYAEAIRDHILSWIEQCPYGRGMQWRSPLEWGIRLINWAWALDLIRTAGVLDEGFWEKALPVIYLHLRDIQRKYSRYSSANNHLIGEAAGVFVAGSYFTCLHHAIAWCNGSRHILAEEIRRQTYADGGSREQALGYHCFVLQFFLIAGLVARRCGTDFCDGYWQRLRAMFEFLDGLTEGGPELPMYGDSDDGYVLDLSERAPTARELLEVGARLFPDSPLAARWPDLSEYGMWLLGANVRTTPSAGGHRSPPNPDTGISLTTRPNGNLKGKIPSPGSLQGDERRITVVPSSPAEDHGTLSSRAFAYTGYYLLQYGRLGAADALSVFVDCGDLGFGAIAAHGHADALSVHLRVGGQAVLVDPGTYDYFTWPGWRDYFRGTRAHNTIMIDGQDQSEMLGPFLWGRKARCRVLEWCPTSDGGKLVAEHDGYTRLSRPVIHRRTIRLAGPQGVLEIEDELVGKGTHEADFHLHFAPRCEVRMTGPTGASVAWGDGQRLSVVGDQGWDWALIRGRENPPLGWFSPSYHRREPVWVMIGRCRWSGRFSSRVRVEITR